MHVKWRSHKIFLSTLYQMLTFRSLEIGFCDPPHNGYLEFGDPPNKRVVEFSDPPHGFVSPPPAVVNAHSLIFIEDFNNLNQKN